MKPKTKETHRLLSNLQHLHDWVEANVEEDHFNIKHFRIDENGDSVNFVSKNDCGTVGCLLGWAPFAGFDTEDCYIGTTSEGYLSFWELLSKHFSSGSIPSVFEACFDISNEFWKYVVSEDLLKEFDLSTKTGALKRLQYFILWVKTHAL